MRRMRNKSESIDGQMSFFDNSVPEALSFSEVCRILSISAATGRNWIRLGKLAPIDRDTKRPVFAQSEIERLVAAVEAGDRVLKSRRNKKKVSGASLYDNYITNSRNISVINEILGQDRIHIDDDIMKIIIANFALQFIYRLHGKGAAGNLIREYFDGNLEIYGFRPLIDDLLFGVEDGRSLAEKFGDILEKELEYVPEEDCLGFAYISLKSMSKRKLSGAYYTPVSVVKELVGLAGNTADHTGEVAGLAGRRILDPCCGTGNFLLYLASRSVKPECLYGQDSDELAVRIARMNLALRYNITDMDFLKEHITCGDTLKTLPLSGYDLILGNPPWGYDFSPEELAELAGIYRSASQKTAESYDLFIERCLSLLSEGGLLAFVLPEAILNVRSHTTIRRLLLEKTEFRFVSFLGDVFSKVQCPSIILGVSNTKGKAGGIKVYANGQAFTISSDRKFTPDNFNFHVNDEKQSCLDEICMNAELAYLKDNARFALGIVTGNNQAFVSDSPLDGYEPVLRGSDIFRYRISDSHAWMRFAPEKFQQVAPTELYRAPEKLLYRFISDTLVFAYDNRRTLSLNSCNILIPEIPGLAVKYILAVLNSSTAAFFCQQNFNSVKVLRSHLEAIPIPVAPDKVQQEITDMVDSIMEPAAKVGKLYDELDDRIMELYGLSVKHRDIIRESLKGKNRFLPPEL
jgi:predicted RNA methylase